MFVLRIFAEILSVLRQIHPCTVSVLPYFSSHCLGYEYEPLAELTVACIIWYFFGNAKHTTGGVFNTYTTGGAFKPDIPPPRIRHTRLGLAYN